MGLILLWLHPRVAKEIKWVAAAACGLLMICGLASLALNDARSPTRSKNGRTAIQTSPEQKEVVVEGDTVKIKITIHHGAPLIDNVKTRAFEIAQRIYGVAVANPTTKTAEVTLIMNKQGVQDEFGRPWEADREMGSFEVGNLDEVRKYVDGPTYAVSERVSGAYQTKIRRLKYADLLTK